MSEFRVTIIEKNKEEWTQIRFKTKDQKTISDYQQLTGIEPCKANSRYTYFEVKGNVFKSIR